MNNLGIRCYVVGKDARREAKPNGRSIRKPRNAADAQKRPQRMLKLFINEP